MLGPRIIRNYIVLSACMLTLAIAPPLFEKQAIAPADAIGGENAQQLECPICMDEDADKTDLFTCLGSGSDPRALHKTCLKRSDVKDKSCKKICPICTHDWETQLMNIRSKAVKDLLVNCSKFKKIPGPIKEILRHAIGAAEFKEILLQMAGSFKELSKIHEQFQAICKRLLETYVPVSKIYDGVSGESTLEKTIYEMDNAFEEFKEDKIRALPLRKGCQLLVDAPKNIYTENMLLFMSTPMFFAQLNSKQIIDLGKRLFTFARGDANFEEVLTFSFTMNYVFYSSDILNSNVFKEMLDLIEGPARLEEIQVDILEGLREYIINVRLFPDCCERLAKIALTNSRIEITEKLCIMRELGFFTDFTKETRDRVIDYWEERGIKEDEKRALEILHLKDSNIEPQKNSNDKVFELLERIKEEEECIEALQLEFYYNILTCLPDESFFEEIGRLLLSKRTNFMFFSILPFLPQGELEQRENIVLRKPEGCCDKIYLLPADISYLYSGVSFGIALNSFLSFVARVIGEREIWMLEPAAIHFGLFFKKDLENGSNAKLFFDGLKKNDLCIVMPLFKKHFAKIPQYEICIANSMGNILKNISLIEDRTFIQQILCALCDTKNEKVHIALCKHFSEYLQEVLETGSLPLFPYILLRRIFRERAFSKNIESAQIREMIKTLATHDETKPLFERYMDVFYSCADARAEREANAIVRKFAQSGILNDKAAIDQNNA